MYPEFKNNSLVIWESDIAALHKLYTTMANNLQHLHSRVEWKALCNAYWEEGNKIPARESYQRPKYGIRHIYRNHLNTMNK